MIYKIITKIIANRLKPLLAQLISPKQTKYVQGRQILDGIMVACETIHSLKATKKRGILTKLDLCKPYDKLNWNFLYNTLRAFWFCRGLDPMDIQNGLLYVHSNPLKVYNKGILYPRFYSLSQWKTLGTCLRR